MTPLLSNLTVSTTNTVNLMFNSIKMAKATNYESVEGLKAKGMVNALTRIGPDLVPLWTNLI